MSVLHYVDFEWKLELRLLWAISSHFRFSWGDKFCHIWHIIGTTIANRMVVFFFVCDLPLHSSTTRSSTGVNEDLSAAIFCIWSLKKSKYGEGGYFCGEIENIYVKSKCKFAFTIFNMFHSTVESIPTVPFYHWFCSTKIQTLGLHLLDRWWLLPPQDDSKSCSVLVIYNDFMRWRLAVFERSCTVILQNTEKMT